MDNKLTSLAGAIIFLVLMVGLIVIALTAMAGGVVQPIG